MSITTAEPASLIIKPILIGLAMLLAALLAVVLRPSEKLADQIGRIDLETMIPESFGDWKLDKTVAPVNVNPQRREVLNTIYAQTLSRTYFNADGQRVMLSIAYGGNQSDNMQVHKPERCYTAQGFQVFKVIAGEMVTDYGILPVKRLLAVQGQRNEPITYWFTVGDHVVGTNAFSALDFKLHQLSYGLTGKIPDGMIVRVSTIDPNEQTSYDTQNRFVHDLLQSVSPKDRLRLIGKLNS
jgi:EpsI family protein